MSSFPYNAKMQSVIPSSWKLWKKSSRKTMASTMCNLTIDLLEHSLHPGFTSLGYVYQSDHREIAAVQGRLNETLTQRKCVHLSPEH